ncbi:hypothetical protein M5K25_028258 [Dendrobium thyrsiflorum]|uniref:Uncharacterized protein n=1 Tax=Dendrobium thyrsiflorum TaxID=117978 RepID=A0ABD0TTR1_DENTH
MAAFVLIQFIRLKGTRRLASVPGEEFHFHQNFLKERGKASTTASPPLPSLRNTNRLRQQWFRKQGPPRTHPKQKTRQQHEAKITYRILKQSFFHSIQHSKPGFDRLPPKHRVDLLFSPEIGVVSRA